MLNRISTLSDQNTDAFGTILSVWVTQRHHATSMLYLCLSIRDAVSKSNASLFAFHIEKSSPRGEALSHHPSLIHQPHSSRAHAAALGPFWGQHVCACALLPAALQLFFWGGGGRHFSSRLGFVSFENTPCLRCSFSSAQCSSPFPRPGLVRASDLG